MLVPKIFSDLNSRQPIGQLLLVGLAYFACGKLGLATPYVGSHITLFWLPSGIAVAALLRWGYSCWPGISAGAFLVNWSIGSSFWLAAGIAAGNTLAPLATVWLLKRMGFRIELDHPRDVYLFCMAAALGMLVSESSGVAMLWLAGLLPLDAIPQASLAWWLGDSAGVLLAGPLLLTATRKNFDELRLRNGEFLGWIILTCLSGWAVFFAGAENYMLPLAFLPLPMVVWAAMRLGVTGASLAVMLLSLIAAYGTFTGVGPFQQVPQQQGQFLLWVYMITLVLVASMITVLLAERKLAEETLRQSEEKLRGLYELSHLGIALTDTKGRYLEFNEAFRQICGYSEPELKTFDYWALTPKEYEAQEAKQLDTLFRTGRYGPYRKECISKNGNRIPIQLNGMLITGHDGQRYIWSIVEDITERKQAEESMRLAATIYQSSAEAVMVTDENNLIIDVNPAFTRQTGYSLKEVTGKNPRLLQSGRHDKAFYREMWQAILNDGHWQGEITDHCKNGTQRTKLASISVIRQPDGRIHRYVWQFFDITDKKQKEEQIWKQANFDTLTGLPNRRLFHDRLAQEIKKAHRTQMSLGLLFIDLDRFKEVNDTLGHAKGDALLLEAARRISACVRETDTVARLGGDEFTVILPEFGEQVHLEHITQLIIQELVKPFDLGDNDFGYISASIGITLYPEDAQVLDGLLRHADQAMYVAKAEGRNRFSYFTQSMQQEAQEKMALTNDLRLALANNELQVYYQPILELTSGRIVKAEALLRWKHPERGMVSPATFIPRAEESGLIHEIGEWVFLKAIASVERWHKRFGRIIQVSINKSPVQFERPDQCAWVDRLASVGLPESCIAVEITEGLLLKKSAAVKRRLLEFRNSGIQISIDDFGTGFSALSYLKQFDIDYLKIDRSFIRDLTVDASDKALTEAIIVMAHKLDIKTIAEGVETETQSELLTSFGCDYVQGHLYSPPVPIEEFEMQLAKAF